MAAQTIPDTLIPGFELSSERADGQAVEQSGFSFGEPLSEKYRPRRVADFIGLVKVRKVLTNLLRRPSGGSLIFVGPPGTGKSTLAMAFCDELGAELHHLPSNSCRLEVLQDIIAQCHRVAFNFKTGKPARIHVILCDECETISVASQNFFLSKMDSTAMPPNTLLIFTCNSIEGLEPRFLSRCQRLDFSSYGSSAEVVQLMERIWNLEAPAGAEKPNLERLVCGNIRESLARLSVELLSC